MSGQLTYNSWWTTNSFAWFELVNSRRCAISSFMFQRSNYIEVIDLVDDLLVCRGIAPTSFAPTKIMFNPDGVGNQMIVASDEMRIIKWNDVAMGTESKELKAIEANPNLVFPSGSTAPSKDTLSKECAQKNKTIDSSAEYITDVFPRRQHSDVGSPVTSFDWCSHQKGRVVSCSIDTIATVWDIDVQKRLCDLVAHDKPCYDVTIRDMHTFLTCGGDGTVRLFDLRDTSNCTICFETPSAAAASAPASGTTPTTSSPVASIAITPLLRVQCDGTGNHVVALGENDTFVSFIDLRMPANAPVILKDGHSKPINSVCWGPQTQQGSLCTGGEDHTVNIWNSEQRCLTYDAPGSVNNVKWSRANPGMIGITAGQQMQLLVV